MSSYNKPFITALIILLVVIVGFLVFYFQMSGKVTDNQNSLTLLKSQTNAQIESLKGQVGTDENQITTLRDQLASATNQISSLSSQLTAANGQITFIGSQSTASNAQLTNLNSQLTAASGQVNTLKGQVTSQDAQIAALSGQIQPLSQQVTAANTKVTDLQNQLVSANSQISTLQSQVSTLSSQIASGGTTGTGQVTLFSGQAVSIPGGQQVVIGSFTSSTSGNLYISGTTTTSTGYVRLNNSVSGSSSNYPFSGATITIPIQPSGYNIIYFGNNDTAGTTATGTLTAYVIYTGSSTSQTSILSSQFFNLPVGQQMLLTTYLANFSGYLYISGTTSTATGYVRIYNPNYGYSTNYPFTNGSTTTIPIQSGNTQIYFGNSDANNGTLTVSITFSR